MRKFMRTRADHPPSRPRTPSPTPSPPRAAAPPPPPPPPRDPPAPLNGDVHKNNGHANGVCALRDERHSSLSRSRRSGGGSRLFEDAAFPPARALAHPRLARRAAWLRPHELCARPRFRGDDGADHDQPDALADRWSAAAGEAGDPHVRCAAAALAPAPRLLDRAAPPQSFRERYTGAFRFRFWVFGEWREVVVDDRLPVRGSRLLGSHARCDDFTLPLLEKAYAKLHGGYAALRGGSVARALQELSGGIVQSFSLRVQPRALTLQVLHSAVPRCTLLLARAPRGAPYAVAGLARVRGPAPAALVRLRAPPGGPPGGPPGEAPGAHWRGAWAPHSAEWAALAPHDRDLLAPRPGDFWMSFEDFAQAFSQLELVHVGPDDWLLERALHAKRPWRAVLARRRWRPGHNAGGPPACPTSAANPQFHVQVPAGEPPRKCHVVVSVTQQYDVGAAASKLRAIGFAVYELGPGSARLGAPCTLRGLRPLDVTHESRAREVVTFFTLPPGRYLVVPHTRRPHTDAAFLLRILTDELTDVWEANEDNVIVRDVAAELALEPALPREVAAAAARLGARAPGSLDARGLRAALRREWRACLCAPPSLELCRALVALRDAALGGALAARDAAALLPLLAYWRAAFLRGAARRCGGARACSYGLRALLRAAGVSASNKVLEALVLRFARGAALSEEAYVMALARLHLAHERYRSLSTKMKSNPLSLEEMILMTIYS